MARKPTGRPNGRPKIQIDNEQFKKLCELQCTKEEIAGFFNCSEDTIENYCKNNHGESFSAVFKKLSYSGKMSLRRYQFELAKHNASMAIFLGKQYLGQKDYPEDKNNEDKEIKVTLAIEDVSGGEDDKL